MRRAAVRTERLVAVQRIAVSYDDAIYLDLLSERLTAEGFETHFIRGQRGEAPYRDLRHIAPALIILDIYLSRSKAGWRMLDHLRRDPALGSIPIIVCVADPSELEQHANDAQHNGYEILLKPFAMDDLLALVHRLIGLSHSG